MYIHTCIYVYMYAHTHTHTNTHTYKERERERHIHTPAHTHTHTLVPDRVSFPPLQARSAALSVFVFVFGFFIRE